MNKFTLFLLFVLGMVPDRLVAGPNPTADDLVYLNRIRGQLGPVAEDLDTLSDLEHLDLEDTRIDDSGLSHIENLSTLPWLTLSKTLVTDEGLAHLASLHNLEWLDLWGTAIKGPGLAHLESLKNLHKLNLV